VRAVFVAGGIGVAPLFGLAEAIIAQTGRAPEVILASQGQIAFCCVRKSSRRWAAR
jgi:NAD(P)H-flavin reductase